MRHNKLKWLHLENSFRHDSSNYYGKDTVVVLVKESGKPIIEHIVTAIITIGLVFAIALMILSVSLLISANRDQELFSHYLEDSLANDVQMAQHPN